MHARADCLERERDAGPESCKGEWVGTRKRRSRCPVEPRRDGRRARGEQERVCACLGSAPPPQSAGGVAVRRDRVQDDGGSFVSRRRRRFGLRQFDLAQFRPSASASHGTARDGPRSASVQPLRGQSGPFPPSLSLLHLVSSHLRNTHTHTHPRTGEQRSTGARQRRQARTRCRREHPALDHSTHPPRADTRLPLPLTTPLSRSDAPRGLSLRGAP